MWFFSLCEYYSKFLHFLLFLLGLVLLFCVGLQVAGRYVSFIPQYLWPQEIINFSLIWAIFIGSVIGVREGGHFNVDIFQYKGQKINPVLNVFLKAVHYFVLAAMIFVFIHYGWIYFEKWGLIQETEITEMNLGWLYAAVPVTGASWLLYMVESLAREFGRAPADAGRE